MCDGDRSVLSSVDPFPIVKCCPHTDGATSFSADSECVINSCGPPSVYVRESIEGSFVCTERPFCSESSDECPTNYEKINGNRCQSGTCTSDDFGFNGECCAEIATCQAQYNIHNHGITQEGGYGGPYCPPGKKIDTDTDTGVIVSCSSSIDTAPDYCDNARCCVDCPPNSIDNSQYSISLDCEIECISGYEEIRDRASGELEACCPD